MRQNKENCLKYQGAKADSMPLQMFKVHLFTN